MKTETQPEDLIDEAEYIFGREGERGLWITSVTPVTPVTPVTSVTSVTSVTPVTPVTSVTPVTPVKILLMDLCVSI